MFKISFKRIGISFILLVVLFTVLIIVGSSSHIQQVTSALDGKTSDNPYLIKVEQYINIVDSLVEENDLDNYYKEIILGIIYFETEGQSGDVMNSSLFESNKKFPRKKGGITDPHYSIQCGVIELKKIDNAYSDLLGEADISAENRMLIIVQSFHCGIDLMLYVKSNGYNENTFYNYLKDNEIANKHHSYAFEIMKHINMSSDSSESNGYFDYPLQSKFPITSVFGSRYHPITGKWTTHKGIDYGAGANTPIIASEAGVITLTTTENSGGYGNLVVIKHNDKYSTYYAHCSSFALTNSKTVAKGEIIAYVGTTGQSTGNHLHFEIRANGTPVSPQEYLDKKISHNINFNKGS